MEDDKTFKTKSGYCHILPDQIVMTRDGIPGKVTNVVSGNSIYRILLMHSVITLFLFYSAYSNFQKGQFFISVFSSLIGLFLIYSILTSLNNSATPVIKRNKIKEIKLKKAIVGLTRSSFEVLFEDDNGKIKKRLIMLPGSLTNGQIETEKAIKLMTAEGLLK